MKKQTMTQNELWQYVDRQRPHIESALRDHLPLAPAAIETRFNEAVEYALFSGGKRLRPVLTLLGAELFGGKPESVMPAAAAVEFIHTSSLIFDDLPCMDDARKRRGKLSLHEKFGEGIAVLAAIGFLNAAYGLALASNAGDTERALQAHAEIVECVGASGMIGGQSLDLALAERHEHTAPSPDHLASESLRNLKTSALMRLSLRVGAILSGANYLELAALSRVAGLLGDAYQLSDDLLDWEEDAVIFGDYSAPLAIGQGRYAASTRLAKLVDEAKHVLIENFPASNSRSCLVQLAEFLGERKS